MKEIRVTRYEAFDGTVFSTAQACKNYELTHGPKYKMYDRSGEETLDYDLCYFVALLNTNQTEDFIADCERSKCICEGVMDECPGLYMWNEDNEFWMLLDDQLCQGLNKAWKHYKELCENGLDDDIPDQND